MKARRCFGLTSLYFASIAGAVQAADLISTNSTLPSPQSSDDLFVVLFKMAGAFIFVVSIFVLGVVLFKRSRFFSIYKSGPAQLKILETKPLGYRTNLVVVGYNQHRYLLAVSATGVSLLSPLPDSETKTETANSNPSFSEQLNSVTERKV